MFSAINDHRRLPSSLNNSFHSNTINQNNNNNINSNNTNTNNDINNNINNNINTNTNSNLYEKLLSEYHEIISMIKLNDKETQERKEALNMLLSILSDSQKKITNPTKSIKELYQYFYRMTLDIMETNFHEKSNKKHYQSNESENENKKFKETDNNEDNDLNNQNDLNQRLELCLDALERYPQDLYFWNRMLTILLDQPLLSSSCHDFRMFSLDNHSINKAIQICLSQLPQNSLLGAKRKLEWHWKNGDLINAVRESFLVSDFQNALIQELGISCFSLYLPERELKRIQKLQIKNNENGEINLEKTGKEEGKFPSLNSSLSHFPFEKGKNFQLKTIEQGNFKNENIDKNENSNIIIKNLSIPIKQSQLISIFRECLEIFKDKDKERESNKDKERDKDKESEIKKREIITKWKGFASRLRINFIPESSSSSSLLTRNSQKKSMTLMTLNLTCSNGSSNVTINGGGTVSTPLIPSFSPIDDLTRLIRGFLKLSPFLNYSSHVGGEGEAIIEPELIESLNNLSLIDWIYKLIPVIEMNDFFYGCLVNDLIPFPPSKSTFLSLSSTCFLDPILIIRLMEFSKIDSDIDELFLRLINLFIINSESRLIIKDNLGRLCLIMAKRFKSVHLTEMASKLLSFDNVNLKNWKLELSIEQWNERESFSLKDDFISFYQRIKNQADSPSIIKLIIKEMKRFGIQSISHENQLIPANQSISHEIDKQEERLENGKNTTKGNEEIENHQSEKIENHNHDNLEYWLWKYLEFNLFDENTIAMLVDEIPNIQYPNHFILSQLIEIAYWPKKDIRSPSLFCNIWILYLKSVPEARRNFESMKYIQKLCLQKINDNDSLSKLANFIFKNLNFTLKEYGKEYENGNGNNSQKIENNNQNFLTFKWCLLKIIYRIPHLILSADDEMEKLIKIRKNEEFTGRRSNHSSNREKNEKIMNENGNSNGISREELEEIVECLLEIPDVSISALLMYLIDEEHNPLKTNILIAMNYGKLEKFLNGSSLSLNFNSFESFHSSSSIGMIMERIIERIHEELENEQEFERIRLARHYLKILITMRKRKLSDLADSFLDSINCICKDGNYLSAHRNELSRLISKLVKCGLNVDSIWTLLMGPASLFLQDKERNLVIKWLFLKKNNTSKNLDNHGDDGDDCDDSINSPKDPDWRILLLRALLMQKKKLINYASYYYSALLNILDPEKRNSTLYCSLYHIISFVEDVKKETRKEKEGTDMEIESLPLSVYNLKNLLREKFFPSFTEQVDSIAIIDYKKRTQHFHVAHKCRQDGDWSRIFPWLIKPKASTFINVWHNEQDPPGAFLLYCQKYTVELINFLFHSMDNQQTDCQLDDLFRKLNILLTKIINNRVMYVKPEECVRMIRDKLLGDISENDKVCSKSRTLREANAFLKKYENFKEI